jgi:hypothetical protein
MGYNAVIEGSFFENMGKAIDMFINMSRYTSAKRWYQILSTLVLVGIICFTLLEVAGNASKAYADGIPGGMFPIQLYAQLISLNLPLCASSQS